MKKNKKNYETKLNLIIFKKKLKNIFYHVNFLYSDISILILFLIDDKACATHSLIIFIPQNQLKIN